jgi:hypothetical protein
MAELKGLKFGNAGGKTPAKKKDEPSFWSGLNLNDLLTTGSNLYLTDLKSTTDAQNAAAAIQLEKLKIQQQQVAAQTAASTSSSVVNKIKAYALPIAITGALVIGGIAAYFYFKKKKVD